MLSVVQKRDWNHEGKLIWGGGGGGWLWILTKYEQFATLFKYVK